MAEPAEPAEPWESYRRYFVEHFVEPGDAVSGGGLQICTELSPALWDDPIYGTWLGWELVANNIPVWGWSYAPSSGNRVTDAYRQFLMNVDPVEPGSGSAAVLSFNALRESLASAFESREADRGKASTAWASVAPTGKQFDRSSFHLWFDRDFGAEARSLASRIDSLTESLRKESRKVGKNGQLIAEALLAYNNPAYQAELVDNNGGRGRYHRWSLSPGLADFLARAKAGTAQSLNIHLSSRRPGPESGASPGFMLATTSAGTLGSGGFLRILRPGPHFLARAAHSPM